MLVFCNDILVYNQSLEDHEEQLRIIIETLKNHKLYMNAKKCLFAQPKFEYLGHISSSMGVVADLWKIEAMLKWPATKTLQELRILELDRVLSKICC